MDESTQDKDEKTNKRLLKIGIGGTVFAALCCFTPFLVVIFGAIGLSALVGYLDVVLFPALGLFVLLTIYANWRSNRNASNEKEIAK